uniref:DEAD/DEAH box helicase n=1 Tax=uncultured Kocuria sp. TaxID=259305 RepID=UPI00262D1B51
MAPEPALNLFTEHTRAWFSGAFAAPTAAQEGAWRAIAARRHALIVAPTGSGKTLAAFLWALDRFVAGHYGTVDLSTDPANAKRRAILTAVRE